jgi:phosphoribosylaminoimidazolecarboxamide formyltransferase / IMP cyclohydrolase
MSKNLRKAYRTILGDRFPRRMEISFVEGEERQTMAYDKVTWPTSEGEQAGLRYGENPDQEAALYRLIESDVDYGDIDLVKPGLGLVCDAKLIQSGKHLGKINMTDVDAALLILRYLADRPACAIIKHNNPCGVAQAETLSAAFARALAADRIAAFGGAVVLTQPCDRETAELIAGGYVEVVAASSYEAGAVELLAERKNLRIVEIPRIDRLADYADLRFLELKSLLDGGVVVQTSFTAKPRGPEDLQLAEAKRGRETIAIARKPTAKEFDDLLFGWFVEAGVTSNSVLYVKDGATVAIGTGEQDRVGVARIAREKAYRNTAVRLAFERHGAGYDDLDADKRRTIDAEVTETKGGLIGSAMISDAFFPFPDGLQVGLDEGVAAVIQPGGSLNDAAVIEACNAAGATMVFTGQRSFKH